MNKNDHDHCGCGVHNCSHEDGVYGGQGRTAGDLMQAIPMLIVVLFGIVVIVGCVIGACNAA